MKTVIRRKMGDTKGRKRSFKGHHEYKRNDSKQNERDSDRKKNKQGNEQ